jgi:hypothetical protein
MDQIAKELFRDQEKQALIAKSMIKLLLTLKIKKDENMY